MGLQVLEKDCDAAFPEKPTTLSELITNVLNTKRKHVQQLTSNAKALAPLLRALSGP